MSNRYELTSNVKNKWFPVIKNLFYCEVDLK